MRDTFGTLSSRVQRIERSRRRLDGLYQRKLILENDLNTLYEGLYIGVVIGFERFLEEVFFDIMLNKKKYKNRDIKPRVSVKSSEVLDKILLGGRKYADWLPFDRTEQRAKIYLRGGRPFSELTNADKQILEHVMWIRNATVHAGAHAMKVFESNVIGTSALRPQERKPAGFLRSQLSAHPINTRFQYYATAIVRIAHDLSN